MCTVYGVRQDWEGQTQREYGTAEWELGGGAWGGRKMGEGERQALGLVHYGTLRSKPGSWLH